MLNVDLSIYDILNIFRRCLFPLGANPLANAISAQRMRMLRKQPNNPSSNVWQVDESSTHCKTATGSKYKCPYSKVECEKESSLWASQATPAAKVDMPSAIPTPHASCLMLPHQTLMPHL